MPRKSCQASPTSAGSDGRVEFVLISNQDIYFIFIQESFHSILYLILYCEKSDLV